MCCRSCLNVQEDMRDLFTNYIFEDENGVEIDNNINLTYSEQLHICTNLKFLETDNLPKMICLECVEELTVAYKFRKKCEQSDLQLRRTALVKEEADAVVLLTTTTTTIDETDQQQTIKSTEDDNYVIEIIVEQDEKSTSTPLIHVNQLQQETVKKQFNENV